MSGPPLATLLATSDTHISITSVLGLKTITASDRTPQLCCRLRSTGTTLPRSSSPLRPARPLIWMYSPDVSQRKPPPSNFRAFVNTTVLAGMLSPVENVSVAKSTCTTAKSLKLHDTPFRALLKVDLWQAEVCNQDCLKRISLSYVDTGAWEEFSLLRFRLMEMMQMKTSMP